MKNSDKFFQLSRKAATVLCMKFVEIIILSKNKEEISDEIITKNLNNKEIAGMQYHVVDFSWEIDRKKFNPYLC